MLQGIDLVEIAIGSGEETRHSAVALQKTRIADKDLETNGIEPRRCAREVRRDHSGESVGKSRWRRMAGHTVHLVQQDEPPGGEILVIVVTAVKTLEPDNERIIHRLRMGRVRHSPLPSGRKQNQDHSSVR